MKVVPRAKKNRVREESGRLKVWVTAPAVEGKANKAVQETLAEFFQISKSRIRIIRGEKSREKVVEVEE